jgi:hypothetical protein
MLTCDKCNASLEDGSEYCSECGSKVYETIYCSECGAKTTSEFDLCQKCGKPVGAETPKKLRTKLISRFSKKNTIIMIGGVAIILVVAALFVFNPFKSKKLDSVIYIKDKQINFTFSSKIKPFEITSEFINSQDNLSSEDFKKNYNLISYSEDGNLMFYPDNIDNQGMGEYYLRDLRKDNTKQDTAKKIDTEISIGNGIKISKDGSKAFYIKGSDSRLYYNDMTDKDKIDSDVDYFYINDACDYIVYVKSDGSIYEKDIKNKKDKEKIESEAFIQGVTEDLNKIYYLKDESLYLKERDKDKVKIDSSVEYIVSTIDGNGCYYVKENEVKVKLSDYVVDDMAEADKAITMPEEEKYQKEELVQGWYEDYYETVTDWDGYNASYDKYNEKLQRDELRTSLSSTESIMNNTMLYYFDGTKEKLVSENISDITMSTPKNALVLYSKYKISDIAKTKLSVITSTFDVETLIEESKASSSEMYAAIKEVESSINQSKAASFSVNYNGTAFYYLDNFSEDKSYGTLMEVKLNKDKLAAPLKIDEDVNDYRFGNESDSVIYFKGVKNDDGDMYQDGKTVAKDVMLSSVYSFKNSSNLVYFTDYSDSGNGTLEILKDGKANKISDDVNSFVVENESNIAYLLDYNVNTGKGDAMLYNNSDKPLKIDYDVTALLWKFDLIDFSSMYY